MLIRNYNDYNLEFISKIFTISLLIFFNTKNYMNSLDGYLFQNEIGKGFSSKVYKATKKSNCETVAVKAINNNALKS